MEKSRIYAIIQTGGKQYQVAPGQTVMVERLGVEAGSPVEFKDVLLVNQGGKVTVGMPFVEGARVVAKSLGEEKGDKVIVFKYKPKTRYRRKIGHRQLYTKLEIEKVEIKRRRKDGA